MSDVAVEEPVAAENTTDTEDPTPEVQSPAKKAGKAKTPKTKTPKAKAAGPNKKQKKTVSELHPKYSQMINEAIASLKDRNGTSRQAILKYIMANFTVLPDEKLVNNHIKMSLRAGVKSGKLKQCKGSGACGSYKLGDNVAEKQTKPKTAKSKSPAKKANLTKVKKPKSASSKKTKSPAKKASGGKASGKTTPQKAKSPAKKATKARKSPKKTKAKKAATSPKKSKKVAAPAPQAEPEAPAVDTASS